MTLSNLNKLRLSLIILLTLLSFSVGAECQTTNTIPIKVSRNKTILPVKVGNSRTFDILLDTGMSFDGLLLYNTELTDSIVLKNAIEVKVPGAGKGKPSTALMDTSANFFIGDIEFKKQKILILQNDIYKGFPSDGVLGYSIFGHFAVEIDYDKNVLILHDYIKLDIDDTWDSVPIYFKNNSIPWIDVSVVIENETPVKISTYIDFASGESLELLEKTDMKFSYPEQLEEAYIGRGLSGDIYGKTGMISKLIIGSYELDNVKTAFALASVRSKQKNADGIVGNNSLRRFNLIFDYAHKKLYLKPNSLYNTMN